MNKVIVTLTTEEGLDVNYELLDVVPYNNNVYAVFYPTEEGDTEVVIFRVEDIPGTEQANYLVETDDTIIQEVYKQFKAKYRGEILFADK